MEDRTPLRCLECRLQAGKTGSIRVNAVLRTSSNVPLRAKRSNLPISSARPSARTDAFSAIMSRQLQELEDKLLFDEVNRRLKLLAIVRGRHRSFEWYRLLFLIPLGVIAYVCVWDAFNSDQIIALWLTAMVLFFLSGISEGRADARMDALIKLLQEDGVLRDTPPSAKPSERS